jgi:hypothetical protein
MQRSRLLAIGATAALLIGLASGGAPALAAAPNPYQVSINALSNTHVHPMSDSTAASTQPDLGAHGKSKNKSYPGLANIDSLANFTGLYRVQGQDSNGNPNDTWLYDTVGNAPGLGGTTTVNAPIVPVSLNLLDSKNNVAFSDSAAPFVAPTVNSPVFQNAKYSSSATPTQFTDAVQRAEYNNMATSDWHTLLAPHVKQGRTMSLPAGSYFFALNPDGTCCAFVLVNIDTFSNLLFPAVASDTTTPVGAAENAGDITTKDMSTFLFPNTYLYFGSDPFAPGACCVLGFHSYDFEPGDASNGNLEKRYVLNYSSWISPGLFGGGFQDVTALSHEIAETYNDPFVASDGVHNITPWWSSGGNCQNDLETGDVIEGLNNATFPVTMNGMTYHPQNEALLQWFESKPVSDALDNAFSYPNETVLPSANVSMTLNCTAKAIP